MRTPQLAEELEAVLVSGSATRRTDILNRVTDLFIYGAAQLPYWPNPNGLPRTNSC
jgi:hypothetical protein